MNDHSQGTQSPNAEGRFIAVLRTTGLFLGPALFFLFFILPFPGLSVSAHRLAAILTWVIVWWISEPVPIPVSAILGALLCMTLRIADPAAVLAPFANPLIFLFMGGFILAQAMSVHGLDRRFAFQIMGLRWVGERSERILFTFGAVAAFISMWISNTAATAMLLPIGLGIVHTMTTASPRLETGEDNTGLTRFGTAMMLMAAYGASAGGIGTPVGTPPNLIGLGLIEKATGIRIPFFRWMAFALPLLILMVLFLFFLLKILFKAEMPVIPGGRAFIIGEKKKIGPWTRGEKNVLLAFSTTVTLWVIPGILALIWGNDHSISKVFNEVVPEAAAALIGALLLFILPIDWKRRTFTITWKEAVQIDWGTLILFGGGLSLGNLMFKTGLAEAVGTGLLRFSGAESLWGITLAAIFIGILVSEATSNTASANMVVPVMISLSMAAGVNPIPPAIGATLGASWGFMLPVSTPPNAIVFGSGLVPITRMIRAGFLFDLGGGLLLWLGLRFLLPLVGLD